MAELQILGILVLAAVVHSEILVYRRYHRYPPNKNYTEVFEIFGTKADPPKHIRNETELNNFLARDAYKTDMNCSKVDDNPDVDFVTRPATASTTLFPDIPIQRSIRTSTRRTTTTPNLTNLFRPTKATIRPNPRENLNPDYNDLGASSPTKKPSVQVTKHPSSTSATTIVIREESDDHATTKRNRWVEVDEEWSRIGNTTRRPTSMTTQRPDTTTTQQPNPTTTAWSLFPWATRPPVVNRTTTPATTTTEDPEVIYKEEEEESDYDGNNYEVLTSEEKDRGSESNRGDIEGGNEPGYDDNEEAEYDEEEEQYGEPGQRRRRKSKRLAAALETKNNEIDVRTAFNL